MNLALAALTGLLRHLEILGDSSNHGTFSLTLGERVGIFARLLLVVYNRTKPSDHKRCFDAPD